jgi:hypothetical protein
VVVVVMVMVMVESCFTVGYGHAPRGAVSEWRYCGLLCLSSDTATKSCTSRVPCLYLSARAGREVTKVDCTARLEPAAGCLLNFISLHSACLLALLGFQPGSARFSPSGLHLRLQTPTANGQAASCQMLLRCSCDAPAIRCGEHTA